MQKRTKINKKIKERWDKWRFSNTILLIFSMSLFIYLASTPTLHDLIIKAGNLGYIGAFFVGFFSVSTFTVAPATLVLFNLAENLHVLEVAILAGLGAMAGDSLIYKFVKKKALYEELRPIFVKIRRHQTVRAIFKSPLFAWIVPVAGAFIIAFPLLPDEVGLGILGMSNISKIKFTMLTFVLNACGVFMLVTLSGV